MQPKSHAVSEINPDAISGRCHLSPNMFSTSSRICPRLPNANGTSWGSLESKVFTVSVQSPPIQLYQIKSTFQARSRSNPTA